MICGLTLVLALMTSHAFAQFLGFNIDGYGVIDDPCTASVTLGNGESQIFTASQKVPDNCANAPNWDWSTNCTEGSLGGDCTTGSNTCTLTANDPITALENCKVFVTDLANIVSGGDPVTCEVDVELKPTATTSIKTTSSTSTSSTSTTTIKPIPETTTTIKICPFKKIYDENSEEIGLLKYFRDNVLSQTPEGQEIIRLYYEWSPVLVEAMKEDEAFKEEVREMIEGILPMIRDIVD